MNVYHPLIYAYIMGDERNMHTGVNLVIFPWDLTKAPFGYYIVTSNLTQLNLVTSRTSGGYMVVTLAVTVFSCYYPSGVFFGQVWVI